MQERHRPERFAPHTATGSDQARPVGAGTPMRTKNSFSPSTPPEESQQTAREPARMLLIEADQDLQGLITGFLADLGYVVDATHSDQADLGLLGRRDYALVIVDVDSARNFLLEYPETFAHSRLIILTSLEGLNWIRNQFGASSYRYLLKPLRTEELAAVVEQQHQMDNLREQNRHLMSELKTRSASQEIIGVSLGARRRRAFVSAFADHYAPILISGERGTGKETLARALHLQSRRAKFPFIHLDSSRLTGGHSTNLLFGSVEFTQGRPPIIRRGVAELSGAGTVYVSEISQFSHQQQRQLLDLAVAQRFRRSGDTLTHHSELRVIMGSELTLQALDQAGLLLAELSETLSRAPSVIEPLRERVEDIPLFVERFSQEIAGRNQKEFAGFTPEALDGLCGYWWPGNVAELKRTVERSIVRMRPQPVDLPQLRNVVGSVQELLPRVKFGEEGIDFYEVTSRFERALVESALRLTGQNQRKASFLLRLKETTLSAMIRRLKVNTSPDQG